MAQPVSIRAAKHPDFARVVFTVPPGVTCRSQLIGELLVLTFPHAGRLPGLDSPPAPMLSVTGGQDQAAIGVPAGLRTHVWQIDARVIVDVFTAPPAGR